MRREINHIIPISKFKDTITISTGSMFIKNKNDHMMFAGYTAASIWGYSPFLNKELTFIVPRGYNPKSSFNDAKINIISRTPDKFNDEYIVTKFENKKYMIQKKEASFVQIIKLINNKYNDQYISLIRSFFDMEYNKEQLYFFAKRYKVLEVVKALEGMAFSEHSIR